MKRIYLNSDGNLLISDKGKIDLSSIIAKQNNNESHEEFAFKSLRFSEMKNMLPTAFNISDPSEYRSIVREIMEGDLIIASNPKENGKDIVNNIDGSVYVKDLTGNHLPMIDFVKIESLITPFSRSNIKIIKSNPSNMPFPLPVFKGKNSIYVNTL